MKAKQLVTIAVVSTLLIGGGAGLGAASPADRAGTADGVGPSDGLPEQVPGHVGEVHDRIDSFLNGSIDDLGGSLGDLLGGDEASESSDDSEADSGADNRTSDE